MAKENRSITLDKELIDKCEKLALERRRSFSNMIEIIIEYYFNSNEINN
jgi:hypothetical protein